MWKKIKTICLYDEDNQNDMMKHVIRNSIDREVNYIMKRLCTCVMGVLYPENMIIFEDDEVSFLSLNKIYYNLI